MKEYEVTLTSGIWYVLAKDKESAAWAALELSKDEGFDLLNVRLSEEW
jgi:hypothetical protein